MYALVLALWVIAVSWYYGQSDAGRVALSVLVTAVVFWLAHVYAYVLGRDMSQEQRSAVGSGGHKVFEGMPDAEALTAVTLTETDGRTAVAVPVTHATRAHRDAHINSGMEGGLQEALDLLEQVAASLR